MQPSERPEFIGIIEALAATFGRQADEPLLMGYWMGLEDLPLGAVKQGAVRAMRQSRFMPTVSELRELAGEMPPALRATLAWQAVMQAVARHDYYATVLFDDAATAATIANVWRNWMGFCEALEREDEKWLRKEFERVYVLLWSRGANLRHPGPLLGFHERENRLKGYEVERPVLCACGLGGTFSALGREAVPLIEADVLKGVD